MTLGRTTAGIRKAEGAEPAHGQISSTDALRRVLPTTVSSYLQFRGWICQETLCDRSSVTFDLRQCALPVPLLPMAMTFSRRSTYPHRPNCITSGLFTEEMARKSKRACDK